MVELGAVHDIGHRLGGRAKRDGQHAGGQRVERAAVSSLLRVKAATHAVDHVRAGHAGRLVDDEPAVERATTASAHRVGP